jgi:hypothetical protein
MATSNPPRNRKERRAQAHSKASPKTPKGSPITLSQPSRAAPPHKTLLEIAAERELVNVRTQSSSEDSPSIVTTVINPDGTISELPHPASSAEPVPTPHLDVALHSITLTLFHFTLTVLVHHQYATELPSVKGLFLSSTVFSPTPWLILVLVLLLHPRSSDLPVQVLFAAMSIVAGGWLVYATNEEPYMAVMRKAPALGTLWVWAIVELKWECAVACLGVVGSAAWWNGYTIF